MGNLCVHVHINISTLKLYNYMYVATAIGTFSMTNHIGEHFTRINDDCFLQRQTVSGQKITVFT